MTDYIRTDVYRGAVSLSSLENIIEGRVRFTLGKVNDFNIRISNADSTINPGYFKQGDLIDIYMGQSDDYSKIMSGIIYKIETPEDEVVLIGYDWSDYLKGPKCTRRYEYQDYGYILRDLIGTYSPKLSSDYILDFNQIIDGEYRTQYHDLIEIIEDILDLTGYRMRVTTDKKVLVFPKEESPIFLDSFKTALASDDTTWTYPSGWSRDATNHIVQHTTIENNLYSKGVSKASTLSDLIARTKVRFTDVTGGSVKKAGLSLKGDGSSKCLFGYLDQANQKLEIGASDSSTLLEDFEDISDWSYGEAGTTLGISGDKSSDWKTQGTYSYLIKADGITTIDTGTEAWLEKEIDLTDITSLVFDAKVGQTGQFIKYSLYLGTTLVWQKYALLSTPPYATYVDQSVDTSGIVGPTTLKFDWYNACAVAEPSSAEFYFDYLRGLEMHTTSTPFTVNLDEWYPLKVQFEGTTLTASSGDTIVSKTIETLPSGTLVSMDADIKADFDDYGLYTFAKHSLTEDNLYNYNIKDDLSDITNKIIIVGGNESKYDGFDTTKTLDRWTIPTGSSWTISDGYLSAIDSPGYIFGGNQYWTYLDYQITSKYSSLATYDYFYRRTDSSATHNDGFHLRVKDNELHLVCATDGTIASYTLSSPPFEGDIYKIKIKVDNNLHEIFLNNIRRINAEDEHYPRGYIGLYATTNAQVDLINCKSDKKILASAQDVSLYDYGIKEEIISKPEIRDRSEAINRASLELALKKITKTSGTIQVPGDYKYSIGDTISLDLPDVFSASPRDYLILDLRQNWKGNSYVTELKIAEKIAGIEELIRQLREETRILAVREVEIVDLVESVQDAITTLSDEATYTRKDTGTFRLDEAKLEVSDLG